jgi:phosphohistidine phosphatase
MRTLLLLRHAKSSWDSPASRDFDRPLAERGVRDAPRMGKLLSTAKRRPDAVLASTARRARETAELALAEVKFKGKVDFTDEIYEASASRLLELIRRQPTERETLLMVGHNPGFEDLVCALCGPGGEPANIRMPTAALACIEFEVAGWNAIAPGEGVLAWLAVPKIVGGDSD